MCMCMLKRRGLSRSRSGCVFLFLALVVAVDAMVGARVEGTCVGFGIEGRSGLERVILEVSCWRWRHRC